MGAHYFSWQKNESTTPKFKSALFPAGQIHLKSLLHVSGAVNTCLEFLGPFP